jgi:hypothetical protein
MEYRLSLMILVLGSLGFSVAMLVFAGVSELIGGFISRRGRRRPERRHKPPIRSNGRPVGSAAGAVPEVINELSGIA